MSYCKVDKNKIFSAAVKMRNNAADEILLIVSNYQNLYKKLIKMQNSYSCKSVLYRLLHAMPELSEVQVNFTLDHRYRYENILDKCNEIIVLCELSKDTVSLSKEDACFLFNKGGI